MEGVDKGKSKACGVVWEGGEGGGMQVCVGGWVGASDAGLAERVLGGGEVAAISNGLDVINISLRQTGGNEA